MFSRPLVDVTVQRSLGRLGRTTPAVADCLARAVARIARGEIPLVPTRFAPGLSFAFACDHLFSVSRSDGTIVVIDVRPYHEDLP